MYPPLKVLGLLVCGLLLAAFPRLAQAGEEEQAREHFKTGQLYYSQGKYADALHEFSDSYRLSRRPALLYNIGVCQERLGQDEAAISSYALYVEEVPDAPDRERVKARIDFLRRATSGRSRDPETQSAPEPVRRPAETRGTASSAQPAAPAVGLAAPPPSASAVEVKAHARPLVKRPLFWTGIIGGAAVIAVGVALGVVLSPQSDPVPSFGTLQVN